VRPESARFERRACPAQDGIVDERAQQLIVTAIRLVRAREDRIDDL